MDYKNSNDKQLWERCRKSDERAYNEIFKRHYALMLRIAMRYVKDSMIAEELVMDCFFNLWAKRGKINIKGKLLNYLCRCIYNSVVSHLDKKFPVSVCLEQVESTCRTDHSTDSRLISEDVGRIYHAALEKLSPRRREVFVLSRHENLTHPQIAHKMNLSVDAVEHYMVAALDGLRTNMRGCISILVLFFASIF